MTEGCLTFPYLFLSINRPRTCTVEFEDDDGKKVEKLLKVCFLNLSTRI